MIPSLLHGSLVIQIASRGGVVVCADKRQTIDSTIVRDDATKLVLSRQRSIAWATGTTGFTHRPTHTVRLDIFELLHAFFSHHPKASSVEWEVPLHQFLNQEISAYLNGLPAVDLPPPSAAHVYVLAMARQRPALIGLLVAYRGGTRVETFRMTANTDLFATAAVHAYGSDGLIRELRTGTDPRFAKLRSDRPLTNWLHNPPTPANVSTREATRLAQRLIRLTNEHDALLPQPVGVSKASDCVLLPYDGRARLVQ